MLHFGGISASSQLCNISVLWCVLHFEELSAASPYHGMFYIYTVSTLQCRHLISELNEWVRRA